METEKVSIIMSAYNIEKYLAKGVESVINQTYKNIEILLIDDGSTDSTAKICDDFAKKDNRVKVVHKTNGGVSSAWNAGLDNATGDYIAFVDGDDWVDKDYIQELYNALKKYDADISVCDYYRVTDGALYSSNNASFDKFVPAGEVYNLFFCKKRWNHNSWGKLYKKHIFKDLRYDVTCRVAEDLDLICSILDKVEKGIATTSQKLYYYVVRDGSVTTSFSEKRFDRIKVARRVFDNYPYKTEPSYRYVSVHLFYAYCRLFMQMYKAKDKRYIKKFNELFNEDYKKFYKYLSTKQKFYAFIFRHFRLLYILKQKIVIKHEKPIGRVD